MVLITFHCLLAVYILYRLPRTFISSRIKHNHLNVQHVYLNSSFLPESNRSSLVDLALSEALSQL